VLLWPTASTLFNPQPQAGSERVVPFGCAFSETGGESPYFPIQYNASSVRIKI
jgi:hypothetical protein